MDTRSMSRGVARRDAVRLRGLTRGYDGRTAMMDTRLMRGEQVRLGKTTSGYEGRRSAEGDI